MVGHTPRLIHPIDVVIEQIDKANTFYDQDYREPIQKAARKVQTTLPGQVTWERAENVRNRHLEIGDIGDSDGAVMFRYFDIDNAGITFGIGDRIIKLGRVDVDVYITSWQHLGHYAATNGPAFIKVYFADKRPARKGLGIDYG